MAADGRKFLLDRAARLDLALRGDLPRGSRFQRPGRRAARRPRPQAQAVGDSMSKRFIWTALAWTALAALAAGAATPAMAQKTVTIVREIDTDRYDPQKSTSRSGAEVMYMIGDTLVNLDYDMKTLKPGLATSWTRVARRPHLHLQAAQRRHLLLRQEDDREGCGRDLRALARSRDQGPGEVAHGRRRQGHRARRRHGRVQAQEAVLRAALPDDAVLPHHPERRAGQAARRRLRRQGGRRHRPVLPRKLDAAQFDGADQACRLQVGPADLRRHRGAGRQGDLEGRARGEYPRDRAAGRAGRCQPVRALLVAQGPDGRQEALGHQGRELLLELLHRLQGRQGDGERRSRAPGHQPRRRPEGDHRRRHLRLRRCRPTRC